MGQLDRHLARMLQPSQETSRGRSWGPCWLAAEETASLGTELEEVREGKNEDTTHLPGHPVKKQTQEPNIKRKILGLLKGELGS